MATATTDKPTDATGTQTTGPAGFGAYGAQAASQPDLGAALDKQPESKTSGSVDFTDSDKRWLKDIGITVSHPRKHHEAWETDYEKDARKHEKWNESFHGRLAMRAVSRGVVGAAFYAAANMYGGKAMKGYTLEKDPEGVLQTVARIIDKTVGKGIQSTVRTFSKSEEKALKAVQFRDTVNYGYQNFSKGMGRSLGHEAMLVTFDFASMSFGDYMTRYFIGMLDPNAKHHWMKEGHIDVPGGLKDLLKNIFRGITYASGEDMAVAIPYVYGMRAQRNIINKYSPGFKYDADLGLNGGSYRVKNGQVVGDYQLEGMLDLQGRFSWYNVGTKMFRDAYSNISTAFTNWWEGDRKLHMPAIDPNKLTAKYAADAAGDGLRYLLRTTIKVMGYMIPATIAFFVTRSPQSKVRGVAIDAEKGVLYARERPSPGSSLFENAGSESQDTSFSGVSKDKPITPGSDFKNKLKEKELYYKNAEGIESQTDINPFATASRRRTEAYRDTFYKEGSRWYSGIVNPIGRANYRFGSAVNKGITGVVSKVNSLVEPVFGNSINLGAKGTEKFARLYANAAVSYTPYFMMKTDVLAAEWDTARTDMGLDRTLDGLGKSVVGLVTLNGQKINRGLGEFVAGLGETRRSLMREPFTDPKREEQAQRERWRADPEHSSNEAFQLNGISRRVRSGNGGNASEQGSFAHEGLKPKPITPATFTPLKYPESWTAQEALRKFQEASPQGQSVH